MEKPNVGDIVYCSVYGMGQPGEIEAVVHKSNYQQLLDEGFEPMFDSLLESVMADSSIEYLVAWVDDESAVNNGIEASIYPWSDTYEGPSVMPLP